MHAILTEQLQLCVDMDPVGALYNYIPKSMHACHVLGRGGSSHVD